MDQLNRLSAHRNSFSVIQTNHFRSRRQVSDEHSVRVYSRPALSLRGSRRDRRLSLSVFCGRRDQSELSPDSGNNLCLQEKNRCSRTVPQRKCMLCASEEVELWSNQSSWLLHSIMGGGIVHSEAQLEAHFKQLLSFYRGVYSSNSLLLLLQTYPL